jgi:hypothetical protein
MNTFVPNDSWVDLPAMHTIGMHFSFQAGLYALKAGLKTHVGTKPVLLRQRTSPMWCQSIHLNRSKLACCLLRLSKGVFNAKGLTGNVDTVIQHGLGADHR